MNKNLSYREKEVLERVALGEKNREIAQALGVVEGTISKHLCIIFQKLNVHKRKDAIKKWTLLK
jgi:DNA-binding NarL/FixJ family response regulator